MSRNGGNKEVDWSAWNLLARTDSRGGALLTADFIDHGLKQKQKKKSKEKAMQECVAILKKIISQNGWVVPLTSYSSAEEEFFALSRVWDSFQQIPKS